MAAAMDNEMTRRRYVQTGAAVVGGGGLVGCSDFVGEESKARSESEGSKQYTVSIEPAGEVQFDGVI